MRLLLQQPLFNVRLCLVRLLLQQTLHCDDVSAMLDFFTPAKVHIANRVSCGMDHVFARDTLQELVGVGTLQP